MTTEEQEYIERAMPIIDQYCLVALKLQQHKKKEQSVSTLFIIHELEAERVAIANQLLNIMIEFRRPAVEKYINDILETK